jgi:hypothetical protein
VIYNNIVGFDESTGTNPILEMIPHNTLRKDMMFRIPFLVNAYRSILAEELDGDKQAHVSPTHHFV